MRPRLRWTLIGLSAVWVAVVLMSMFSPDLVSGSDQEHLKLPAMVDWLWGVLSTMVLLRALRFKSGSPGAWMAVGLGTTVIWAAATAVAIWGPEMVTGGDPTRLPLAAIIAPIIAMLLTRFLVEFTFDLKDSLADG